MQRAAQISALQCRELRGRESSQIASLLLDRLERKRDGEICSSLHLSEGCEVAF